MTWRSRGTGTGGGAERTRRPRSPRTPSRASGGLRGEAAASRRRAAMRASTARRAAGAPGARAPGRPGTALRGDTLDTAWASRRTEGWVEAAPWPWAPASPDTLRGIPGVVETTLSAQL